MPKLKTNKGAAKRFKVTATGKVKRPHSGKRHLLNGKARKRKRQLRKSGLVAPTEQRDIRRLLPYG